MNVDSRPDPQPADAVHPTALHEWLERGDGPPVVGFRVCSAQGLAHEVDWHRHVRGQLIHVDSGLLTTRTAAGDWSLPAGCAGWMPPGELHTVSISGPLQGWGLLIAPAVSAALPAQPCVLGIGELVRQLALRVVDWPFDAEPEAARLRLSQVLLDELAQAPPRGLHLPMPQDRRLLRIALKLLADPADNHDLAHWADWAGLSTRSLTRHFRHETGLSFAQWRQQARLAESLRLLHEGERVGAIAHQLGYSSPSAFVTAFRQCYGLPPARWLQRGQPADTAPGLASPAASG